MSTYDAAREHLEQQLLRLLGRAGKIETDLRQTRNLDWTEQATEQENDEVLEGLDAMTRGDVRRIRAALHRIASGTYGVCARCGQQIGAARLTAMPSALTCVICAPEQQDAA